MKTSSVALATIALAQTAQAISQKTEFQTNQLRPPIWMIGEYYV